MPKMQTSGPISRRHKRGRVAEQEAIIEERESMIADQRDRIAALESEAAELRDELRERDQDEEQHVSHRARPWDRVKTWVTDR
jgi:uncharacterized coiled-coil protein SlyX